jgi:hypothetical protein
MWAIIHITIVQIKVAKLTQTYFTPFKDEIFGNSWWCWFKHKHLKLTIRFAKGLEVSTTQGLISETCNSFYQNLTTMCS